MREPQPFHRLFGLSWMDFFQGTSVTVEIELDLSLKQQFIDLVIIRNSNEPIPRRLPDGFDDLAAHNLVTFKSHRGALDAWALWELIGHFVNYRKQSSPSLQDLSPEEDYRLIAVCARFPHNLSGRIPLAPLGPGVYQASGFGLPIRVVVASQLPSAEHNAMLHLFSAKEELLRFGQAHYRPHSPDTSSLLYNLFRAYCEEPTMPDQLKEFVRQTIDEILQSLPPEERLKGLPPEERLKGLPPEERLKGLPPEERLRGLSADEVAKALPPDVLRALARRLKENGNGE